jgi:hypothetical protein
MSLSRFIPFAFVAATFSNACITSVEAQSSSTVALEGGGLFIEQIGAGSTLVSVLQVSARRATTNTAISGSALLLAAPTSGAAAQATLGTELALPMHRPLRLELSGTGTTFAALSGRDGSSRNGFVRPQYVSSHFGAFASLGAGESVRENERKQAHAWDAGFWGGTKHLSGSLIVRQSFTNDYLLVEASGFGLIRPARRYMFQDALATVGAKIQRVDLTANYARRAGVGATRGSDNAFVASMTANVSNRTAVVLTGGKQLADIVSGVPAAHIFSATLRYQWGKAGSSPQKRAAQAVPELRSPFDTRVEPRVAGGAIVTVRIDAPAGATVELMGTHNEWTIVPLARVNDAFEIRLELPRGSHRLAVRVNSGEWKAPQGLARTVDDLGGESGIVIVP